MLTSSQPPTTAATLVGSGFAGDAFALGIEAIIGHEPTDLLLQRFIKIVLDGVRRPVHVVVG